MGELFPTFSKALVKAPLMVLRGIKAIGRGVRKSWKPVVVTILILIAACQISGYLECVYIREPLIPRQHWDAEKYSSSRNPYRHYETAIRLLPNKDRCVILEHVYPAGTTVPRETLLRSLARIQPAMAELRKGAACSVDDFQFPHKRCALGEEFPEYAELRRLTRIASVDAREKIAAGKTADGANELLDALVMGDEITRSYSVLGVLTSRTIKAIVYSPIHKALRSEKLSATDYRLIARRLETVDAEGQSLGDMMGQWYLFGRGELTDVLWFDQSDDWLREPVACKYHPGRLEIPWASRMAMWADGTWRHLCISLPGVKTWTIRNYDRMWSVALEYSGKPYPEAVKLDADKLVRAPRWINRDFCPPFPQILKKTAIDKALKRGLMLVAALEAYRLEHGTYPDKLDQLVGPYIGKVPTDPFTDGKSFIYSREGAKYVLYSIGPDMKDDGGKAVKPYWKLESELGDMVLAVDMRL